MVRGIIIIFLFTQFLLFGVSDSVGQTILGGHLQKEEFGDLDEKINRRYIKILTTKNSFDYYLFQGKAKGIQYEMVRMFINDLNKSLGFNKSQLKVQFELIPVDEDQLIPMLLAGKGDFIAAAMPNLAPDNQNQKIAYSKPYRHVDEVVVTRDGTPLNYIFMNKVYLNKRSSYFDSIMSFNNGGESDFLFEETYENLNSQNILELISLGKFEATIVDSALAELAVKAFDNLRIYRDLDLKKNISISWVTRAEDKKLLEAINKFVPKIKTGSLMGNILSRRYFSDLSRIKNTEFSLNDKKISSYDDLIKKYSKKYGLDWRLMAALCYQESRFKQNIKNEWGAIGLFQIKKMTATEKYVNIPDIEGPNNAENNIHAGIKYLHWIKNRYFDEYEGMSEKNKVRMAIASYNAGPLRVRKAIQLAKKMGLNHRKWFRNVELALLKMRRSEPVIYVSEINKRFVSYQLLGHKLED